jgi:hypothetical protein
MKKEFSVSNIHPSAKNVLELPDADNYYCRVFDYKPGHSNMTLVLTHKDSTRWDDFYLLLDSVRYYEGPFWWTGINISKGVWSEFLKLYFKVTGQGNFTEKEIEEFEIDPDFSGELLVIPTPHFTIKIIASYMMLSDERL